MPHLGIRRRAPSQCPDSLSASPDTGQARRDGRPPNLGELQKL
jgi:hypothetical protein